tara:strand:- start:671 stop:1111 length:441 start_codon:yes stop_codon:yes gene_type:complete
MKRLTDFINDPLEFGKLSIEDQEKTSDPNHLKWFLETYLMEPGDQIKTESVKNEFGLEVSYIITQPDGKWFKHGTFERNVTGIPSEEEARWRVTENAKKFLKWIARGLDPDEFNKHLGTDFKESDIDEILSKEEIMECLIECAKSK